MHAFNKDGQIKKYNNPEEIIQEHYEVRYQRIISLIGLYYINKWYIYNISLNQIIE